MLCYHAFSVQSLLSYSERVALIIMDILYEGRNFIAIAGIQSLAHISVLPNLLAHDK